MNIRAAPPTWRYRPFLRDIFAAKQAKSQGLIAKKETRQHEQIANKKIQASDIKYDEMAST